MSSASIPDPQLDHRDDYQVLFDSTYLRWFHLQGKEVRVTIEKVEKDVELTVAGGVKKVAPVVSFKNKGKPLVLNKTNGSAIAAIHGRKPSQWIGKKIVLYATTTKMFNPDTKRLETVGCIRIKQE